MIAAKCSTSALVVVPSLPLYSIASPAVDAKVVEIICAGEPVRLYMLDVRASSDAGIQA